MPRFVLLYHDCPPAYERPSHWDFMLETGDVLRTWALEQLPRDWQQAHSRTAAIYPNCPAVGTTHDVAAIQLGEHRIDYLELEGPLTGRRGTVIRVAAGMYETESEVPSELRLVVSGAEVAGHVILRQNSVGRAKWSLVLST
jgi:hypothetical protein